MGHRQERGEKETEKKKKKKKKKWDRRGEPEMFVIVE